MAEWIIEIRDGKFPIGKWTELVRCKDCKYCIAHNEILFCNYKGSIGDWRFRTEADFCSRGERKGERREE